MFPNIHSTFNLYKPIAIPLNPFFINHTNYTAIAGSDIQVGAQVYLLYEIPTAFLARNFNNSKCDQIKIHVHEINGCIVGPGLYQEWATHVHAAKSKNEQNLELCRNVSNNMLLYRAIKPIHKGDELLAWYSSKVQQELCNLVAPANDYKNFNELLSSSENETTCKRCLINFEYTNILKSHLLFDICSKSLLTNNMRNLLPALPMKYESSSPVSSPSSTSSSTTALLCSSTSLKTNSSFLPMNQLSKGNEAPNLNSKTNSNLGKGIKRGSSSSSSSFSYSSTNENIVRDGSGYGSSKYNKHLKLSPKNIHEIKPEFSNQIKIEQIKTDNLSNETQKSTNVVSPISVNHTNSNETSLISNQLENEKLKNDFFKNRQSLLNKSLDWKITFLDGTQTVELNMADELGKPKKSHVCLFCGKIYNRKYGLKIHLRTHTGYKPLKCKVCSRPFSDPSNLNKHVRLHSQGETPYRCPYCGKVLVRKRDLDRHIISRHTNNNENDSNLNNTSNNNEAESEELNVEDDIDVDGDDTNDNINNDHEYHNSNSNNNHNEFLSVSSEINKINAESFLNLTNPN